MKCRRCKSERIHFSRITAQEIPKFLQFAIVRLTCSACLTRFNRPRLLCSTLGKPRRHPA